MKNHDLKNAAIQAIREYHSDDSVSLEQTLAGLEEIASEAASTIDAVEADIAANER